jgi:peptidyl-tRNA hydrolase
MREDVKMRKGFLAVQAVKAVHAFVLISAWRAI